ncbi:MAG: hypothetical protein JST04_01070 [Bdellovibrionales bacterium]|nr:hypothetical protein [Bdellovibrionales bacterium]
MIVRSFFRGVVGNNVANSGISGNATNALTTTLTTNLTIIINGTTIFNALYNTLTAPVTTTIGSLSTTLTAIAGSQGSGYKLVVDGLEVWEQATMRVVLSQSGYYTYDNSFYLFGYDLGNNPNESVTDNVLFDIVMLMNWSAQATQVGNAYSKIACYRKPYSDRIYCYDMTSQPAEYYNWSNVNDNRVYDTRNSILCDKNDVEIDITTILGRWVGGSFIQDDTAPADQDVNTFNGVFIPKYSITPLSPICGDSNCTFIDSDAGEEVIFDSNLVSLNIDDTVTFPYVTTPIVLNFKSYDVQGNLLDEQNISINTTGTNFAFDPSYIYSYDPGTYTGDLLIVTTISVDGVFSCVNQYISKGCGFICITKIGCNKYTIKNISGSNSIDYTIGTVDDDTFSNFTTKLTGSLNRLAQLDIDLGDDGLYVIQITDGTNSTIQFLPSFCKLDSCLASFTKKIICSERPKCNCGGNCGTNCNKISSTTYEFNSVMSLAYMYFSIMNTNYFFDKVLLSNEFDLAKINYPNDLKELYTIKDILNQAKAYCIDCGSHFNGNYKASQGFPVQKNGCSSC